MFLAIKTEQPQAELAILDRQGRLVKGVEWLAGRQLAAELLDQIKRLIDGQWRQIDGVIVFRGPGSFTGLRIAATVANTLGFSLGRPVAGASGNNWLQSGWHQLQLPPTGRIVVPNYGAEANITRPKA